MKQLKTIEKQIGDNTFYLKPFPAFVAANISGDLASILLPLLGALVPVVAKAMANKGTQNVMDTDLDDIDPDMAVPAMTNALSNFNGNEVEKFLKKLLIEYGNISVENETEEIKLQTLSMDLANEIFCGEIQDMYLLCFEVIKLNFSGFFKKLGDQFGDRISQLMKSSSAENMGNLM